MFPFWILKEWLFSVVPLFSVYFCVSRAFPCLPCISVSSMFSVYPLVYRVFQCFPCFPVWVLCGGSLVPARPFPVRIVQNRCRLSGGIRKGKNVSLGGNVTKYIVKNSTGKIPQAGSVDALKNNTWNIFT